LLVTETLRVTGLGAGLSLGLARWRRERSIHDPGKVVADLAVAVALGGDCLADVAVLRAEPELYGPVASDPLVSRKVAALAADPVRALKAIRAARARARERAWALAGDAAPGAGGGLVTRASTPTEGGFCTYQPVVHGGACPWNLNCHSCDKFVLSGADLLYWRRKREQWASIAERAPDDATADYLHQVFAPTAQAIDGLERPSPGSACSTRRSRWTCGVPRTTTTGCGTCHSAPPTSPQLLAARPRRKDAE